MSTDGWLCCAILLVTCALFVSDRLRLDVVAMLALLALALTGLVTPQQALAGFSNPVVVMLAGLFVVGAGLTRTGVAEWLGQRMGRLGGKDERRLLVVVMVTTAALSGLMSSTGTVAIMLPVVVTIARRAGIHPGRLLMPLSFASLLGGMLTLVGTPPNLIASEQLRSAGLAPFGFFSFTAPGLVMLALGVAFMVSVGRRLLPHAERASDSESESEPPPSAAFGELAVDYGLGAALHTLVVREGSPIAGASLGEVGLRRRFGLNVIGITSPDKSGNVAHPVLPTVRLRRRDRMRVQGSAADVDRAARELDLAPSSDTGVLELPPDESLAEVVLPRRSQLVGKTLREAAFRTRYRATVLALRRGEQSLGTEDVEALCDERLRPGDTLLIKGRIKHLGRLREQRRNLVIVTEPRAPVALVASRGRAAAAVIATLGMLALMSLELVPHVVAVLLAAVTMVVAGCVRAPEAYREINWESVVLIAGVLPIATALDGTGVMALVVELLSEHLGGAGPRVVMAALFLVTSLFSQVISNTATTVLVAPVALGLATDLGFAPEALLMSVAIAASTAFATPIASPVHTIVLGPGGYRFGDFTRVGLPLQLVIFVATVALVPLIFPL